MSGSGTAPGPSSSDRSHMEQVLALAALGEGTTRPNPRVGCVVVADGEVVGGVLRLLPGRAAVCEFGFPLLQRRLSRTKRRFCDIQLLLPALHLV